MEGFFSQGGALSDELAALSGLIKEADDEAERGADAAGPITPATIGAPAGKDDGVKPPSVKPLGDPKAIWTFEEVTDALDDDVDDGRMMPEYEFLYKQAVSTADNYLGMSYVHKDPSSSNCEQLVVRIELPGTDSVGDLDLDVKPERLRLQSPVYRLALALPHPVDDKKGQAKWDAKKETLSVTLPIKRELGWVPNALDEY